jgi:hypothetical protein
MKFIKKLCLNDLYHHTNINFFIVEYAHTEIGNDLCNSYNLASHAKDKDVSSEMYEIKKTYIETQNNINTFIMETSENFDKGNPLHKNHKISIVLGPYDDNDSYYALYGGTVILKPGQKSEDITNDMRKQILIYYQKAKFNK